MCGHMAMAGKTTHPYFPVGVSTAIGKAPSIDAPLGKNFACLPSLTLTQSLGYQGS